MARSQKQKKRNGGKQPKEGSSFSLAETGGTGGRPEAEKD